MHPTPQLDGGAVTAIAELSAQRTQFMEDFHGLPVVAHHKDITLSTYAHLLPQPKRVKRDVKLDTAAELTIYLEELLAVEERAENDPLYPVVFADASSRSFTLYPNFHEGECLSWLDHKVRCTLDYSRELKLWMSKDSQRFTQEAFAEFIDENVIDISQPTGAEMLTIAKTLEATRTEVFKSSVQTSDGTHRFTWDNTTNPDANNTVVPDEFFLALPIFDGDKELVKVRARLFHRLPAKDKPESGLTFYYKLHRIEDILEKLWDERVDMLRGALAGKAQVYAGTYTSANV
jgi:uncharacterized protein YfdQ (DUF2303 family)